MNERVVPMPTVSMAFGCLHAQRPVLDTLENFVVFGRASNISTLTDSLTDDKITRKSTYPHNQNAAHPDDTGYEHNSISHRTTTAAVLRFGRLGPVPPNRGPAKAMVPCPQDLTCMQQTPAHRHTGIVGVSADFAVSPPSIAHGANCLALPNAPTHEYARWVHQTHGFASAARRGRRLTARSLSG